MMAGDNLIASYKDTIFKNGVYLINSECSNKFSKDDNICGYRLLDLLTDTIGFST